MRPEQQPISNDSSMHFFMSYVKLYNIYKYTKGATLKYTTEKYILDFRLSGTSTNQRLGET